MTNRRGQKPGPQRGNRLRFPYEPRVVGGKLLMPAELQAIHRYVVETPVLEAVTEEIRLAVETVWCPSSYVRQGCSGTDKGRLDYTVYFGAAKLAASTRLATLQEGKAQFQKAETPRTWAKLPYSRLAQASYV